MIKFIKFLYRIEETVLVSCMLVMGTVLTIQIIMRFVFHYPLEWVEELARYLQIWITFFGIGYGVRQSSHIGMTLIKNKMPAILQCICDVVSNVASLIVFIVLIKASCEFLQHQNVLSTAMKISMQYVYVSIPIGGVIYILYNITGTVLLIKHFFDNQKLKPITKEN